MVKINPVSSRLAEVPMGLAPLARAKLLTKQKVVIIVGPTASGKSGLTIRLARKYGGEIISADSRQVYRGMDIGTGKVPRDRIEDSGSRIVNKNKNSQLTIHNSQFFSGGVRHYLIDIVSPKKQFTASDFKKLAEKTIKNIAARGKIPMIAGGTGFYIDILIGRMATAEVPANPKLRKQLEKLSPEYLFKLLSKLDPKRAKTIDSHNSRRLIRAIEVFKATKKSSVPISRLAIHDSQFNTLWLGLNPKNLDTKIKKRLDERLKEGMIDEISGLHDNGLSWKKLDNFGLEYRWISRFLIRNSQLANGNSRFRNSEEYKNLLRDILKYSKRQMAWFKKNKEIHWFTLNGVEGLKNTKEAESLLSGFLNS